jgi:hypothetical protein
VNTTRPLLRAGVLGLLLMTVALGGEAAVSAETTVDHASPAAVTSPLDSPVLPKLPIQDSQTAQTAPVPTPSPTMPSALPRPNSGRKPETPGDPGGWQQAALFGTILLALAFIGWRVWANTRRQARR